jgi:hypothetical protein
MKSKQKPKGVTIEFPVTIDFADLGTDKKVAKEVMDKQPRKKRTRQSRKHYTLS